jgi:hypothetical protein
MEHFDIGYRMTITGHADQGDSEVVGSPLDMTAGSGLVSSDLCLQSRYRLGVVWKHLPKQYSLLHTDPFYSCEELWVQETLFVTGCEHDSVAGEVEFDSSSQSLLKVDKYEDLR